MDILIFVLIIIIIPFIIDVILVVIGSLFSGKKVILMILTFTYLFLNIITPISILIVCYYKIIGYKEVIAGVLLTLFLRAIDIFSFQLGKTFISLWKGEKQLKVGNK